MNGVRLHGSARTFTEECLDGAEALRARGFGLETGRLLAVYPFGHRNPFLRMLYAAAFDFGFATLPLKCLSQLDEVPSGLNVVVHHHWVHRIFDNVTDTAGARDAVDRFLTVVKKQKDAGRTLVWTVHNILSHRGKFPQEEARLRADFAELVDHIHIMNPNTVSLCAQHYAIDTQKTFQIPHPSYAGVYGDYISKEDARLSLGLQAGDKVFLLFGELGPYKGTRQFLTHLDAMQRRMGGNVRIVIAGKEGAGPFMEDIYRLTAGRVDVQLHLGHIDDQNVQTFFRAADVAVCAHTAGLNSGVAATALTFACPTVMAEGMKGSVESADDYIFSFDPDRMNTIVAACEAAFAASRHSGKNLALRNWAQKTAPTKLSNRFFDALVHRL